MTVVMATETWLSADIKNSEIFPPEYDVYRKDRSSRGGGVLLLINNRLISSSLPELDSDCEIIWAKISIEGHKQLVVGSFYRPPNTNQAYLNNLQSSLSRISNTNSHVLLGGDFNAPDIDWENEQVKPTSSRPGLHSSLLETINDAGLVQIVDQPTRNNNILDLLLTNNSTLITRHSITPGLADTSDHDNVAVEINLRPKKMTRPPRPILQFGKQNTQKITEELDMLHQEFQNLDSTSTDTESLWQKFKSGVQGIIQRNIPTKLSKGNKHLPWISQPTLRLIRKRNKLYTKWKKSRSSTAKAKLDQLKRSIKKNIYSAHNDYLNSLFEPAELGQRNNQKKFWTYIKSIGKDTFGIPPLKDQSRGVLVADPKLKANILNKQYQSVFTQEDLTNQPLLDTTTHPDIPNLEIAPSGIRKLLENLKPHKATGPDLIPARFLKEHAAQLAPILSIVFSKSVQEGRVPSDWKTANVIPVFKKGNKHEAANYRPVSLTSICSKVLEHVFASHIMSHLEPNILVDYQHGFRSARSCETQLVSFVEEVAKSVDNNKQVDVGIMDFSKAFDKVPHRRLLEKAKHYGIRGNLAAWIDSFLSGRSQKVLLEGHSSSPASVTSGVPQGTVLGPILFLIYVNDIGQNIDCNIRLFADDCIVYKEISAVTDASKLQQNINLLMDWEQKWQMSFNIQKCHIMTISKKRSPLQFNYMMHNNILERVTTATYLGVEISSKLSWEPHISRITAKANRTLGMLRRNLKHAPQQTKALAYKSITRPLLEYSSSVWDPHTACLKDKLESVQRRAARFVHNNYCRDPRNPKSSVTNMQAQLGWVSLERRRLEARLYLFYKAVHGHIAIPVHTYLVPAGAPQQLTRNSHQYEYKFQIPYARTNIYRHSFFPNTVRSWNALPASAAAATSPDAFKGQLQSIQQLVSLANP